MTKSLLTLFLEFSTSNVKLFQLSMPISKYKVVQLSMPMSKYKVVQLSMPMSKYKLPFPMPMSKYKLPFPMPMSKKKLVCHKTWSNLCDKVAWRFFNCNILEIKQGTQNFNL